MDAATLEFLYNMFAEVTREDDWKAAIDRMLSSLRGEFVYDNVAAYVAEPDGGVEVIYARAVGRGKSAEADVAWGETIAGEVLSEKKLVIHEPGNMPAREDRLAQAYLLGLPLYIGARLSGALVFIRFGGPAYSKEHIELASLLAHWVTSVYERKILQDAYAELESVQRQMRLQDDFVSTISHELRTPLGFIKGYSTSLLRTDTTWDKETQQEFLSIIDEEADHLSELLGDMLESARLQSKTISFKFGPLRLDALIRDVAARAKARHAELEVALDFDKIPPTLGDSLYMSQVFENLFNNALKYAPGSPLNVSIRNQTNKLLVSFSDRGKGISGEFLPFLFERFYRVPGDKNVTGTGLGLYICRQIILAHHGNIWAESELEKGVTFFIELPVQPLE